jgi:amino acid adenylation domain-containing protein
VSIAEFVSLLWNLDIRLSAEGERLRVNAPKGVLTSDLREQISDRKSEILKFLGDTSASALVFPPPISRHSSATEGAPLSFAQERLWFLEQLEPGSAAYNVCRAIRFSGPLNIPAIEQSLTEILRRHEILRTTFPAVNGRPSQVVAQVLNLTVCRQDLRHLSYRDAGVERALVEEFQRAFDLSQGPLLRALLLELCDEENILLLTTHHIVSDAWSLGILFGEFVVIYDAYSGGKISPLPELPVQYADYAKWQREWLQGEALNSQLSYWKEQLGNDSLVLDFPTDHPRPRVQSFRGSRVSVTLEESLTQALDELSRREGSTLFMTLLAAFGILLYRYTGQEKILIAAPIANRARPELEPLIGCFVNTLALRTDLSGKPSFRELLYRVRDVCFGAYAHQDLPFEKLVEELEPERDLSRNPLCQVLFILQNAPRPLPNLSGMSFARVDLDSKTSKFDLTLSLRERDGKLIGFVEYSTDLFDASTIERLVGHLQTLLSGIVADPDQPIRTLPLLTEKEGHQMLVEWNDTAVDYPKDCCIHELFEAQVERTPDAVAVQFEGKQLTYRELNRRANQLAYYLRKLGVGPEKLVAICVERSLEMVVGLLGILKAGGAYVPLDPGYPRKRLQFMLQDAQVSILITQEKFVEESGWRPVLSDAEGMEDSSRRSPVLGFRLVCLDRDWPLIGQQSEENLEKRAKAQNLAYVIYTSGSTGTPKSVQIEHRSVVNCLHSIRQAVELIPSDAFLALTTISFDIAALELFLPLTTGAKLVLPSRDEVLDAKLLLDRLKECGATVMQATPSAWKLLLDAGWRSSRNFKILCGGEVLSRSLADQLLEGGALLWNLYGPTETTIWSTVFKVESGEGPVFIGRPISNTRTYVLDSHLQVVPIGVYGEIYIGGDGLARGYLNRAELTAERFIPNPFNDPPGSLLYRTGDRTRYRPDGNIEFLGRLDNQVKIRGHRIEFGEIEAVLSQHPSVKETVVVAVNDGSSDSENPKSKTRPEPSRSIENPKSLVAYVVSEEEQLRIAELRNFLKQKLPEYMIPSTFVVVASLPLMPNGKVDRKRLPPPDETRPRLAGDFVAPRTEIEELVARTWVDVLKIENIGIYDNFFELGGHSLLATQIVARLREAFNRDIPLHVLFDGPTIAELAQELETIIRDGRAPELPPIVPVPRDRPLPLSMNQEHLWRLDRMMSGMHFFNMPYVYQLSGELKVEALEKALREIVRRHEALRTVFGEVNEKPVQIIKSPTDFLLIREDLRGMPHGEITKKATAKILEERVQPFDPAVGPLIRGVLLRLTERESLLLITAHHIIVDHWSMQVFRRELIALYEAFCHGKSSPLPEPRIQFGDYACWERRLLADGLFNDQLVYWKSQLTGTLTGSEGQGSRGNNAKPSFQFNRHSIEIKTEFLGALRLLAKKEDSTLFIVLLTALIAALHVSTGQHEIRVGILVANRRCRETEMTMGHIVNTVILSVHVSPELELKQLLGQIRDVLLRAHTYQEFPMEQLMRELELKEGADRASLFRVLINYQKHDSKRVHVSGLTFASWNVPYTNSEAEPLPTAFDLIFNLKETSTMLTGTVNVRDDNSISDHTMDVVEGLNRVLPALVSDPKRLVLSLV